jgi:hypothetical protein
MLPPGLAAAWERVAGEIIARRARPVCLEPDREGAGQVLVVAVDAAAWRQELVLAGPQLAAGLAAEGFAVAAVRPVAASRPPAPPPPPPPPRQLTAGEREWVASQAAAVADPGLRAAVERALSAQLAAQQPAGGPSQENES